MHQLNYLPSILYETKWNVHVFIFALTYGDEKYFHLWAHLVAILKIIFNIKNIFKEKNKCLVKFKKYV